MEIYCPQSAPVHSNADATAGCGKHRKISASKRALADEDSQRMVSTVPTNQAKRRAPLHNLTNLSSLTRSVAHKNKALVVASKSRRIATTGANETPFRTKTSSSDIPIKKRENAPYQAPASHAVSDVKYTEEAREHVEAGMLATLERETKDHLNISSGSENSMVHLGDHDEGKMHIQSNGLRIDIDSNHKDPQLCASYAKDIYQYLQVSELKRRPNVNYMKSIQHDLNKSMRGVLVDWLVEVAEEYKLIPDTLYLTVAYIDRFLSARPVDRHHLQLLGVACMLIAAKYEEICAPQVEEFCYVTDNTYSRDEVLHMEKQVLDQLHFELTGPTTKTFLRRFLKAAQVCQKDPTLRIEFLASCLADLTLLEYDFLKFLPSLIAGSVVFLAKFTLEPNVRPWNATLQHYTGYKASELKDCVLALHTLRHTLNSSLQAIWEKYRQLKFKCVADIISPSAIPLEYFEDT